VNIILIKFETVCISVYRNFSDDNLIFSTLNILIINYLISIRYKISIKYIWRNIIFFKLIYIHVRNVNICYYFIHTSWYMDNIARDGNLNETAFCCPDLSTSSKLYNPINRVSRERQLCWKRYIINYCPSLYSAEFVQYLKIVFMWKLLKM